MSTNSFNRSNDTLQRTLLQAQSMQRENQLNLNLHENIKALASHNPPLLKQFERYTPTLLRAKYTEDGYINLAYIQHEDKSVYACNPRTLCELSVARYRQSPISIDIRVNAKPIEVLSDNAHAPNINALTQLLAGAEQNSDKTLPKRVQVLIMFGLGLGYQIEELLKVIEVQHLIVIEPQNDCFYAALHCCDFNKIYNHFNQAHRSIDFILQPTAADCFDHLSMILRRIGTHHLVNPFVLNHFESPEYQQLLQFIVERYSLLVSGFGYFDDERLSLSHSIHNFHQQIPIIQSKQGIRKKLNNTPVLLIGNGPSLDNAIDFITSNQGQAIIISCGTALGSLIAMGIKPDFHVEMERSRPVYEWIDSSTQQKDRDSITLLALNTVHPEVFSLFKSAAIGFKNSDVGVFYLDQFLTDAPPKKTLTLCNPTVANTGLAFSIALGFTQIYLIGVDLGFPNNKQHHSSHSKHYQLSKKQQENLGLAQFNDPNNISLPGNRGGIVKSTAMYKAAGYSIETLLVENPGVQCINLSDGINIVGANCGNFFDLDFSEGIINKASIKNSIQEEYFLIPQSKTKLCNYDHLKNFESIDTLASQCQELFKAKAKHIDEAYEKLDLHHDLIESYQLQDKSKYSYQLIKGSCQAFSLALASTLRVKNNGLSSLSLFNQGCQHYVSFFEEVRVILQNRFLDLDNRTRQLYQNGTSPTESLTSPERHGYENG